MKHRGQRRPNNSQPRPTKKAVTASYAEPQQAEETVFRPLPPSENGPITEIGAVIRAANAGQWWGKGERDIIDSADEIDCDFDAVDWGAVEDYAETIGFEWMHTRNEQHEADRFSETAVREMIPVCLTQRLTRPMTDQEKITNNRAKWRASSLLTASVEYSDAQQIYLEPTVAVIGLQIRSADGPLDEIGFGFDEQLAAKHDEIYGEQPLRTEQKAVAMLNQMTDFSAERFERDFGGVYDENVEFAAGELLDQTVTQAIDDSAAYAASDIAPEMRANWDAQLAGDW